MVLLRYGSPGWRRFEFPRLLGIPKTNLNSAAALQRSRGATALVFDDLISTGGTLLRAARAARKAGAKRVIALVTHGLFMPGSVEILADPAIERLVIID